MNIGIIGQGFVGNAVYQKFKFFFKVYTYDLKDELCNSTYIELVKNCKVIFVCIYPLKRSACVLTQILKQSTKK
jgi:lactate dehydrogenase-like 2-hydroxyacid dehydrogenase